MEYKDFKESLNGAKVGDMVFIKTKNNEFSDSIGNLMLGIYSPHNNYHGTAWNKTEYDDINTTDIEHLLQVDKLRLFGKITFPSDSRNRPLYYTEMESIIYIPKKAIRYIDKAYDYCNLNSADDDCIYKAIGKYKALNELNEEQQDKVYDILATRLGFK